MGLLALAAHNVIISLVARERTHALLGEGPDDFERRFVQELVSRHDGKVAAAAQQAGTGRACLYRLLRKHGVAAKSDART